MKGSSSSKEDTPKTAAATTAKEKRKFIFSIERDISLLRKALNASPWQLGQERWEDVAASLSEEYGCTVSARTARDRANALLKKKSKEELTTKTGTEEQQTERGMLLEEIQAIKEREAAPIVTQIGASDEEVEVTDKRAEKKVADEEREHILHTNYAEAPPEASTKRVKRTRAAEEDEMISKKFNHDMELEAKRFKLEEKVKLAAVYHEDQRLEIEMMREKRLADEASQRKDLFEVVKKSMEAMQECLNSLKK